MAGCGICNYPALGDKMGCGAIPIAERRPSYETSQSSSSRDEEWRNRGGSGSGAGLCCVGDVARFPAPVSTRPAHDDKSLCLDAAERGLAPDVRVDYGFGSNNYQHIRVRHCGGSIVRYDILHVEEVGVEATDVSHRQQRKEGGPASGGGRG